MATARDIKRRIKGVKSTGKITRAMEMISAVKMRKAIKSVIAIRPYAKSAIELLEQLSLAVDQKEKAHPLMTERPIHKELYIVIGSNRGLCGAFNTQIMKRLRDILQEDSSREHSFITIGKKADLTVRRFGKDVIAAFPDILVAPTAESMRPIAKIIIEEFAAARVDRVVMVYTDYISVLVQEVKVRVLLPVAIKDTKRAMHEMKSANMPEASKNSGGSPKQSEYTIEPAPETVISKMIPRLLEMELYHAVLESNASQESARMLAMRNATDAAKDMVSDLTLTYNQLRQSKITQEIAELSAGMAAVQK